MIQENLPATRAFIYEFRDCIQHIHIFFRLRTDMRPLVLLIICTLHGFIEAKTSTGMYV